MQAHEADDDPGDHVADVLHEQDVRRPARRRGERERDPAGVRGTVRVAGFATAVRRTLVPVLAQLSAEHPAVRLQIHEHEPAEAFELLAADEHVVRTIASLAGFEPRIVHRVDSLELVQDLIAAGLGVGLLPADGRLVGGVRLVALRRPEVVLRSYAVTRPGRESWAPLRLVTRLLTASA